MYVVKLYKKSESRRKQMNQLYVKRIEQGERSSHALQSRIESKHLQ